MQRSRRSLRPLVGLFTSCSSRACTFPTRRRSGQGKLWQHCKGKDCDIRCKCSRSCCRVTLRDGWCLEIAVSKTCQAKCMCIQMQRLDPSSVRFIVPTTQVSSREKGGSSPHGYFVSHLFRLVALSNQPLESVTRRGLTGGKVSPWGWACSKSVTLGFGVVRKVSQWL